MGRNEDGQEDSDINMRWTEFERTGVSSQPVRVDGMLNMSMDVVR